MAGDEVRAERQFDGSWTVFISHVGILVGLTQEEAQRRARESPEELVRRTHFEWQWRNRKVARERITDGLLKADSDD